MKACALFVLTFCLLAAHAGAAVADDNPAYKSWARYNPKTSVTIKTVAETAGQKTEMVATTTLVKKDAEKVVLEIKTSMEVAGNRMEMPAQQMELPATIEVGDEMAAPNPPPEAKVKESRETVTIAGKKYDARLIESTVETNGVVAKSKSWTSDDVPGMLLKVISQTEGSFASQSTMEVTNVTIK